MLVCRLPADLRIYRSAPSTRHPVQPFHDFDSGPDWWSEDEHKRVIESIATMKGNFIGFHTYPFAEGSTATGTNEPAVWLGLKESVNADGTVSSAYPTSWATTLRAEWGMTAINTSDYAYGADSIFEHDCFGHPLQSGNASLCPWPVDEPSSIDLFNNVGTMWQSAFEFAHQLGVKTCLGTETPVSVPPPPGDVLVPLNLYFSQSRDDHFVTATQCDECDGLYDFEGVIGYVSTTPQPGLISLSTYYNGAIEDNILVPQGQTPPTGYTFIRTEGYAMPAATANASLTPLHQYLQSAPKVDHWAVAGSMIANATADGYADTGVIAQIWTVGPNITNQDYYEGTFLRLKQLLGTNLDYYWIWTPEEFEWSKVNISNPVIQNVVHDAFAVQAAHDAVNATFQLATCGWVVGPLGYRSYLDTVLPDNWAISSIDMNVGNTPVDGNYTLITHHDKWVIPWAEDDPGLTAPELWLNRTLEHCQSAVAYNITGLQIIHWRTRAVSPQIGAAHAWAWDQTITSASYWLDWATAQFGPSVATAASAILISIDSFDTPRPVSWVTGPGTMTANAAMCNWPTEYAWVDTFAALRPTVLADVASGLADANNVERFDYLATSFTYMRGIARMECDWANYGDTIAAIKKIADPNQRQAAARAAGFAARASLVANVTRMMWDHLARVSSLGDLGTTTNAISQSLYNAVGDAPTQDLETLAGEPLPAGDTYFPPTTFDPAHPPLLRVLTVRTMLSAGEPVRLECFVLTTPSQAPTSVTLYVAPLGSTNYSSTPMAQVPGDGHTRYVYKAVLPPQGDDFQWYIQANLPGLTGSRSRYDTHRGTPAGTHFHEGAQGGVEAVTLVYPPTAPAQPQTVTIL